MICRAGVLRAACCVVRTRRACVEARGRGEYGWVSSFSLPFFLHSLASLSLTSLPLALSLTFAFRLSPSLPLGSQLIPPPVRRTRTRSNAPEHRARTRRRIERAQRAESPAWWATLEVSTCPGQPSRLRSRFCFRVRVRVRARTRELHVIHEMHVYMRARSRARLARRIDSQRVVGSSTAG